MKLGPETWMLEWGGFEGLRDTNKSLKQTIKQIQARAHKVSMPPSPTLGESFLSTHI